MLAWKKDMFELKAGEFGLFSSVKLFDCIWDSHGGYPAFMVLHRISERMKSG